MPSKKHKPEEIIGKLREVEIMLGQGDTTAEASRRIPATIQIAKPAVAIAVSMGLDVFVPQHLRRNVRAFELAVHPAQPDRRSLAIRASVP